MELLEFLAQHLERNRRRTLEIASSLAQEDLTWQPWPQANTLGFLLFHIFRSDDRLLHYRLEGTREVWAKEGWDRRWRLPGPPPDAAALWFTGNSWTPEQVRGWPPPPKGELLEYGERERASGLQLLRHLDPARLPLPANPDGSGEARLFYLHILLDHEAQHQGQMDYLAGLVKTRQGQS